MSSRATRTDYIIIALLQLRLTNVEGPRRTLGERAQAVLVIARKARQSEVKNTGTPSRWELDAL